MKIAMYIAVCLCIVLVLLGMVFWFMPWPILIRLVMSMVALLPGIAFLDIGIYILKDFDD